MKLFKYVRELIGHNIVNSIVIILIIVALIGWIGFVQLNTDGIITGKVVDSAGRPVPQAQVMIREKTLNLIKPPIIAETDPNGVFVFRDMRIIEFLIHAQKEGYEPEEEVRYHLYFKGQHFSIPKPLVLKRKP